MHPAAGPSPRQYHHGTWHVGWTAIDLWDHPAVDLLPVLPELAVLAQPAGTPQELLEQAAVAIAALDPAERVDAAVSASILAATRYDRALVHSHLRRHLMAETGIIERSWLAQDLISTAEARGRAEGEARGRAEGETLGRAEGEGALAVKLLGHRIGPLDDALHARVRALPLELIEELALAAVDFDEPSDLHRWLTLHERI